MKKELSINALQERQSGMTICGIRFLYLGSDETDDVARALHAVDGRRCDYYSTAGLESAGTADVTARAYD